MSTLRCRPFCTLRWSHAALLMCLLGLTGCGGSASDSAQTPQPLAESEAATVQGIVSGSIDGDLRVFRGVRYAAAQAPETRFVPPAPAPPFDGTYDATLNGPACAQPYQTGITGEEDCLYANVWAHRDAALRPVMVFLHGGASGGVSGGMEAVDGALLARRTGMVVVTANRRLGVLGNLALEQLIAENPRATAGNYEVLDTIQALKWVQQNARAFNGDPKRVMLVGNSYGGRVVCHILAAPEAAGLFQAVAIISGACGDRSVLSSGVNAFTRNATALDEHRLLPTEAGCEGAANVLQCLRALDIAELIAAELRLEDLDELDRDLFEPVIDGVVVQSDPYTALQNQVVGDIPVITGSTQDDVEFMFRRTNIPDDATYRSELVEAFSEPLASAIYGIYPSADFAAPKDAYVTMWSDFMVNCVAEELARSAESGAPAYLYLISRGFDNGRDAGRGATHAIDVIYLFASFGTWDTVPDAQALGISAAMQAGWSNLAVDPSGMPAVDLDSGLLWPTYEPAAKPHIDFGDPVQAATGYRNNRCDRLRAVVQL